MSIHLPMLAEPDVAVPAMADGARGQVTTVPKSMELTDLREMMCAVSEAAQRLQGTHEALQGEVARLQRELADANAALRRSQALAAMGEMAAGIAHEIRNPLGSILLYAHALAEDLADRPHLASLCARISSAVTGLDAIVRDVLSFARDMTISPQRVDAACLLDRALDACEAQISSAGVRVARHGAPVAEIRADPVLMGQALCNVVRNAVEAMLEAQSPRRQLLVHARCAAVRCPDSRKSRRVVFTVQDTGPGIRPEVLTRVFNPFFTTRRTGTGLGLAIVHRIVDAHGGHVNIQNVPTGGTRVELCLPEHAPAVHPQLATTAHRAFERDAAT